MGIAFDLLQFLNAIIAYIPNRVEVLMQRQKIYRHIDRCKSTYLKDLKKLLQQPSVSPQNIGVKDCAKLVAQYFKRVGCQSVNIVPTQGNPVVYGKYDVDADKTLMGYLMYDTQPYDEPGWTHDPMGAELASLKLPSGKVTALVNRGSVNSKGPLMAFLHALEAIRQVEGELPFNVLLVAEGEEELGSPHLPDFVKRYKKELSQADGCFFPFFLQDPYGRPKLFLGNKGIIYCELECSGKAWRRGPEEFDIHSSHAAWMDSPVWRLIHALSTMTDETGNRIAIEGFYDDISQPPPEEEALLRRLARTFDPRSVKGMNKVSRFRVDEEDKQELLRTYLYGTTLNIDGIWGGYTGAGSKTVLPHKVTVKMDIRLVPHQKPETMLKLMRAHLDQHGYQDITIRAMDAYGWAQTPPAAPIVQAVIRACRDFDREPEVWPRIGGSAPFYLFSEVLKIPFTMGVLGHGGRAHSPDEYIVWEGNKKVAGYAGAVKSMVAFLEHYASP
jgi:acetylornithine deacetylase/succinyl-diaminopimelate desuccinylase-like protein